VPLRGLTVLSGDNGTGKSTVPETLELLHQAARPGDRVGDVLTVEHEPLTKLVPSGRPRMTLGGGVDVWKQSAPPPDRMAGINEDQG
jgi:hypothetical protein